MRLRAFYSISATLGKNPHGLCVIPSLGREVIASTRVAYSPTIYRVSTSETQTHEVCQGGTPESTSKNADS